MGNQITAGLSYGFAKKTDKINIGNYKFDWTNNIRFDLGSFYSGALVATTFRLVVIFQILFLQRVIL
ncbi:MAG: hypothetical protein U9Q04_04270 [Campylobacterota bacterium]|nr:hypothetical protein [Campylobacterota bacterium]